MTKLTRRVLVVDDYEPFRRFASSTLQRMPELQIIGEASDGTDAVQKAKELQPDLILLDIGLPTLNGIEAARRIRELSPRSKILFLSENRVGEIVGAALSAGGIGYVVKSDAGGELLTAVEAALHGRRFVSASLAGQNLFASPNEHRAGPTRGNNVSAPIRSEKAHSPGRHEVCFYSDDEDLFSEVLPFIEGALQNGNAVIVVATASHRDSLLARLQALAVKVGEAIQEGRYIALDASDALSTVMLNGMPDTVRFVKFWSGLIVTAAKSAKAEQPRVAIFGEAVHLLWSQEKAEAAIQIEKLANQMLSTYNIDILCAYFVRSDRDDMNRDVVQRICAEHSAVRGLEVG